MCRPFLLLLLFQTLADAPASAQLQDDFSDLDLTRDPSWQGDLEHWRTGILHGSPALQTFGEARPDTIFLALDTEAPFGRWEFTFAHRNVNLSTFNGARVFLSVSQSDPHGPINGYFVQLGTNNSDVVSLWRVDGGLHRRTELGRSEEALLSGDSSLLRVVVERDAASNWTVTINDHEVLQASDSRYLGGRYFMVWVKHTAQGAQSFFFDDVVIAPVEYEPPPPPPPAPKPSRLEVVINEIQFDPLPGSSEYIELYNRSDSTFDLQRFTFRDSRSPPLTIVDTTSLLPPESYAVLVHDQQTFEAQFRRVDHLEPPQWAALNNGGDFVVLEYEGEPIDSVAYGDDAAPTGFSLERVDPDGPSEPFNFVPTTNSFGGTPGERNTVFEPDTIAPALLFAEQLTSRSVQLWFDEPPDPSSVSAASIELVSASVDSLMRSGDLAYVLHLSRELTDDSITLRGVRDLRGNAAELLIAPIAFIPHDEDLVINEIMYEPRTDAFDGRPNQSEYVELYNRSARRLSLGNLYAMRRADENGNADTLDISMPHRALESGQFYVILKDSAMADHVANVSFSVRPQLSLPNSGDVFRLHHSSGMLIDSMGYDPSLHHPDQVDSRGIAVERIDVDGPSTDPTNWTSSVDPSGGTPGRPNSVRARADDPAMASGISVSPNPFSPDRDGRDDVAAISYRLSSSSSLVRVRIFDHRGLEVRRLIPSRLVGETGTLRWDGLDDTGHRLRTGIYIVVVESFDSRNQAGESYKAALVLVSSL